MADEQTEKVAADLYLDLMKQLLTRTLYDHDPFVPLNPVGRVRKAVLAPFTMLARQMDAEIGRRVPVDRTLREAGRDHPLDAETMIGLPRLDNIQEAVRTVIDEGVPGDWLETGAWRGGASIFAAACFAAYGDFDRLVWVADAFDKGFPGLRLAQDAAWTAGELAGFEVDMETVRANFARYGRLDDRVRFLAGWFSDTLPDAPIEELAILRLDGDMYVSTMDALTMYDRVSPGGYVIVDDYGAHPPCREAITDFRREHGIDDPLVQVDYACVYWRKNLR